MIYLVYLIAFIVFAPLVLVAAGLPFKINKGVRFFEDNTSTQQYDLPVWLKWLQNPEDGLTGDRRSWKIKMKHNTGEIEDFELDYFKAPTFRIYLYTAYL